MTAFYNEIDEYNAQWLRNLIAAGEIPYGIVDTRSIEDITPDELRPFTQCHFFAGIGVWPLVLRRIGWRDDWPIWTGSCPCQPFSAVGEGGGFDDERHLWPAWFHLISERRPSRILGEQVASHDALAWVDLVQADLEAIGYAFGHAVLCAPGVGGAHKRERTYFVGMGDAERTRLEGFGGPANVAQRRSFAAGPNPAASLFVHRPLSDGGWEPVRWAECGDGRYRPFQPRAFPLAYATPRTMGAASPELRSVFAVAGISESDLAAAARYRNGALHAYGNALDAMTAEWFAAAALGA